jgi:outer membrane beta-barrel protein
MTRARTTTTLLIVAALASAPALAQDGGYDFGDGAETPDGEPASADEVDTSSPDELPPDGEAPAGSRASDSRSSLDEAIDLTLQDRIKAVSRKVFLKEGRFELQPAIAVTTNDPFFRTWQIAGRGAYHLNDAFALEIGGNWVPPYFIEKLPPVDLLRQQARLVNQDATLFGLVDAGVTFSPVYGKLAILSDAIIHFDAFVAAGVGAVFDSNFSDDNPLNFVHPTMNIGAGLRVFLLRWLVVRADLRDYVYPQDRQNISTLQNLLVFSLGVGFYFPFDFEYRYEAARVKS